MFLALRWLSKPLLKTTLLSEGTREASGTLRAEIRNVASKTCENPTGTTTQAFIFANHFARHRSHLIMRVPKTHVANGTDCNSVPYSFDMSPSSMSSRSYDSHDGCHSKVTP